MSTLAANGVATTELQEGENKMKRSGALDMTRVQKGIQSINMVIIFDVQARLMNFKQRVCMPDVFL